MKNGRTGARYCPIKYVDKTEEMAAFRGEWSIWWQGLDLLRRWFSYQPGLLQTWRIESTGPDAEPWASDRECKKPVDKDEGD